MGIPEWEREEGDHLNHELTYLSLNNYEMQREIKKCATIEIVTLPRQEVEWVEELEGEAE